MAPSPRLLFCDAILSEDTHGLRRFSNQHIQAGLETFVKEGERHEVEVSTLPLGWGFQASNSLHAALSQPFDFSLQVTPAREQPSCLYTASYIKSDQDSSAVCLSQTSSYSSLDQLLEQRLKLTADLNQDVGPQSSQPDQPVRPNLGVKRRSPSKAAYYGPISQTASIT